MTSRLLNGAEAPFADAFASAVAAAALARPPRAGHSAMAAEALDGLLRGVANELASLAAPTLLAQFSRRARRTSLRPDSDGDVMAFTDWLHDGGLSALLAERPDLDDVLRHQLTSAFDRRDDLLTRLDRSAALLEVSLEFEPPAVVAVPLVNGAYVLADGRGHRVLYKPRGLDMEAALAVLLSEVNERGWGPPLAVASVVDLGDHGFMEHVASQPPSSTVEVHLTYQRFGMLLAIATLVGAADLHGRNIVVGGDGPVIIDAETVLRPPWSDQDDRHASVLAPAILPIGDFVHRAGLLAAFVARTASPWCDVGTDAVRARPVVPTLAAARRAAAQHLRQLGAEAMRQVLIGFRRAYEGIVAEGLPVDVFASTCPRVLLRPSAVYEDLMLSSLSPEVLEAHGRRAALLASALPLPPPPVASVPALGDSVRRAELDSVGRFDFPRFTMPATGGPLRWCGRHLGDAPFEAPLARARRLSGAATRDNLERHAAEVAGHLGVFVDLRDPASLVEVR